MWDDEAPPAAAAPAADPWAAVPTGPLVASRRLVTVLGAPESGKTTLAAAWYAAAVLRGVSGTWVDPTGANGYLARYGRHLGVQCALVRTVAGWAAAVSAARRAARPFNVVLQPGTAELSQLWELIYLAGNQLVCVDEMDQYAPARLSLDRHPLGRLVSQGRNRGVSMVQTARIPAELNPRVRDVADVTVSGRQVKLHVAQLIAREYFHAPELAPLLLQLPPFQYIQVDKAGRVHRGTVKRPAPPS